MTTLEKIKHNFARCDSGELLNPFLHVFLFILAAFSVAFLFFGHTESVQAVVLYQETVDIGNIFVNVWATIGLLVIILHTVAFWVRGPAGARMLSICVFGGFYLWLWASVIYISAGFLFQFIVVCIPHLYFWSWYALQWSRRRRGERVAFV